VYQFIRDHGGWENWDMIEVARVECLDKRDAERIERKYIEDLGASLNKQLPTRTQKEYREGHKEGYNEYLKKYVIAHVESIREYQYGYQLEYRESHKEKKKLYMIEYRAKKKAEKLEAGSI
jgi:hypothetical protein